MPNQAQVVEDLQREGWFVAHIFHERGWKVMAKKNKEPHHYWYGFGYKFITIFKNGRTAEGYYRP